ncbi:cryptochrome/photolyase family protein [Alphaproteobacteria bacterium]|nr:cryptochrome/photolyase family protein [Alphaproteobacteria bacterium]
MSSKSLFIILGNQLFPTSELEKNKDSYFFMAEDFNLCTYEKHHKHKIIFSLSSMRKYAKELESKNYSIKYYKLNKNNLNLSYEDKIEDFISKNKISIVKMYEIEDKFFEKRIINFCKKNNVKIQFLESPMFLNTRDDFVNYLSKIKKPFMATFYKQQRIKKNILMNNDKPLGDKWSYDEDNRKKIPHNLDVPMIEEFKDDNLVSEVKKMVDKFFPNHPGDVNTFWLGTSRKDALKAVDAFINKKITNFGDYEDAVKKNDPFLFHSILSPYLNIGLITPKEIIEKILNANSQKKIPLNSLEGFIRQVIGWREFMRGIYQNKSNQLEKTNFFKHKRKLTDDWYKGTTGIDPIDDAIKDVIKYGYTHHIIRLMHLSNVMNLSQLHPKEIYKWFMEMFVDSSDWVMSPNVYGMGTFSDGGIFSTKPYICGSNYIIKMSNYKKGNWSDIVDGLYWNFIHTNSEVLSRNPRMGMVMMSYRKLKLERKEYLLKIANEFIAKKTK